MFDCSPFFMPAFFSQLMALNDEHESLTIKYVLAKSFEKWGYFAILLLYTHNFR